MLHLVTGGSGSGKSAFAEDLICSLHSENDGQASGPLLYIATMMPYGEETEKKILRHRLMRREKGFETIECYTGIHALAKQGSPLYEAAVRGAPSSVLLECMSNLTANELYCPDGAGCSTADELVRGVGELYTMCHNLVVVTNDVFREGRAGSCEMQAYRETLADINTRLARMADSVTEVVCGIPTEIKENRNGKRTGEHMILITGGACQGKTAYAERTYGVDSWIDGGSCGFDEIYSCAAIRHFELLVRRMMESGTCTSDLAGNLDARNPDVVIIVDEIGCGLVPVDGFERAYREQAGRICTELAHIAERVDRAVCGIGMTIKGGER